MKHIFLTTIAFLLAAILYGQVPQAFNYQGAARTAAGAPIANSTIAIRASILDGSASGTVVYAERNVTTTSGSGIFSIGIGNGTPLSGTFGAINWATGNKFLKIDLDATGGTNYVTLGTTQFLSVPYAQYAGSAGQVSIADKTITGIINAYDEVGTELTDKSGFRIELEGLESPLVVLTDPTGSFRFSSIPSGEYRYLISKSGYDQGINHSFSIVNGGLKQVVRSPQSGIRELPTVIIRDLSITSSTGSNFNTNGDPTGEYNFLNFKFKVTSPKNPIPQFAPVVYFSTVSGFQVTNGYNSPNLGIDNTTNSESNFNYDLQNPQIDFPLGGDVRLKEGIRYYFKVYSPRIGDGEINFNNGSNEASYIIPPKSSVKVQNFVVTTVTSNFDGSNSISFSAVVNGRNNNAHTSSILLNIFYSTNSGVSLNNQSFQVSIADGNSLNYHYPINDGLFTPGSRIYFKAFHSFSDGSGINQTSASNEVSIVIPTISSVNLSGFAISTATSLENGENYLTFSGNVSAPQTNGVRIYYGSTANITPTGSDYFETTNNSGTFSMNQVVNGSNLTPGNTVYFKAFSIDSNGNTDINTGTNVISKVIPPATSIVEGMNYLDGVLVHLFKPGDAGYVAGEVHGLLAMTNAFIQYVQNGWATSSTFIDGLGNGIGLGLVNTNVIIDTHPGEQENAAWNARFAHGYTYPNIFLPSRDELQKLFTLRIDLLNNSNIPPDKFYWTSSQASATEAFGIRQDGSILEISKQSNDGVAIPFRVF